VSPQHIFDLGQRTLQMILLLSGPALLAGMLTGLLVSLVQAVTSIQEATLTFVPKLVAIFAILFLCMPWMTDLLLGFAVELFGGLGQFAR
jgi:flagellar biosynthetic protein FliQ